MVRRSKGLPRLRDREPPSDLHLRVLATGAKRYGLLELRILLQFPTLRLLFRRKISHFDLRPLGFGACFRFHGCGCSFLLFSDRARAIRTQWKNIRRRAAEY